MKVNPETAEVFIDATGSDPIPHIIKGIPVHLRDIRVYADRPGIHVLNPTQLRTAPRPPARCWAQGSTSPQRADDQPVTVTSPLPGSRLRLARLQARAWPSS